jgi:serine/threonine-protein kinase HipA
VGYTPVYDIITTQAYPRYATNPPGLSIEGRKTWAPGKSLENFFKARLGITPANYKSMLEQLCESAVETGREIIEAARNEPRWRDITKQMLHAWNEGMASVRSVRKDELKGLTRHIVAAGFSDAAPPERPEVIGRSQSPPKHRAS